MDTLHSEDIVNADSTLDFMSNNYKGKRAFFITKNFLKDADGYPIYGLAFMNGSKFIVQAQPNDTLTSYLICHELGHNLGIGHTKVDDFENTDNLMHPYPSELSGIIFESTKDLIWDALDQCLKFYDFKPVSSKSSNNRKSSAKT